MKSSTRNILTNFSRSVIDPNSWVPYQHALCIQMATMSNKLFTTNNNHNHKSHKLKMSVIFTPVNKFQQATRIWPRSQSSPFVSNILYLPLLLLLLLLSILALSFITIPTECSNSIAPSIDYSHNMRVLKIPKNTPIGSLIYRLKGSDGDANSQLQFGVSGIEGRALIDVLPVAHSWNEADVYLKANIGDDSAPTHYNLSLYVSDGNTTTQVESTVLVTDPESETTSQQEGALAGSLASPFINTKHIFHVPENAAPDDIIGQVTVLESESNALPVRFEIRGSGAEKFSIKYVFGPRGQSKGEIVLAQPVDYEKQNLFNLKVLALNAWTDSRWDTRNIVTMDIVIALNDVQDTAPVFRSPPHILKLFNTLQPGDLVAKIEAEDGDFGDQRPINYALDAESPLANYFEINKLDGQLRLTRSISELVLHASWDTSAWSHLTILASEQPDPSSYDHLWPPMYSKLELPLMLVDLTNEAPRFLGGWQSVGASKSGREGKATSTSKPDALPDTILHAYLMESPPNRDPSGLAVQWYLNGTQTSQKLKESSHSVNSEEHHNPYPRPIAMDLGVAMNGTFQFALEGRDSALFRIEPSLPVSRQSSFTLFVVDNLSQSNWTLFDRDSHDGRQTFQLDIVARDFGSPQRLSTRIGCHIELLDTNDSGPQFESDFYSFNVYENAQRGQLIGTIRARDPDHLSTSGRVRYSALTGHKSHLFRLSADTGQIILDGQLDRELESSYLLLAEATDSIGSIHSNYTKIIISVIDVNDNAPVFLQSHYDAVLQPDGTFNQPLVVRAIDADEPGTANSQVAYEIIAGNRDEQFVIDSLSGTIYPAGQQPPGMGSNSATGSIPIMYSTPSTIALTQVPPEVTMSILPYSRPQQTQHSSGKILPNREVEETTWSPGRPRLVSVVTTNENNISNIWSDREPSRQNGSGHQQQQYIDIKAAKKRTTSVVASGSSDPVISMESEINEHSTRSLANRYHSMSSPHNKLPPIITLIVRAHDFGIPLRSSTTRVNIFNQALISRTLSVILNGTAEQIESRSEAIERAFSSITGSKVQIEGVETLSDSSSICVAHVRLTSPQHNLVDLTDLTALIDAIDYHPHSYPHSYSHSYPPQHQSSPTTPTGNRGANPTSYINGQPDFNPLPSANITSSSFPGHFFGDFHNPLSDSNIIERRLLIYIIIVAICILSLLVIWMIYWCSQEDKRTNSVEQTKIANVNSNKPTNNKTADKTVDKSSDKKSSTTAAKTTHLVNIGSPLANNLVGKMRPNSMAMSPSNSNSRLTLLTSGTGQHLKPDRYSMYNGQVWFEPMQIAEPPPPGNGNDLEPRVSSAPSANGSLHSALQSAIRVRDGRGQFFPNALGYTRNLASIETQSNQLTSGVEGSLGRGSKTMPKSKTTKNKRRVAPMEMAKARVVHRSQQMSDSEGYTNHAFVDGDESGRPTKPADTKIMRSGSISSGTQSSGGETLILDSDQELLGFDSTGTPIIATLANRHDHLPRSASIPTTRLSISQSHISHKSSDTKPPDQNTETQIKVPSTGNGLDNDSKPADDHEPKDRKDSGSRRNSQQSTVEKKSPPDCGTQMVSELTRRLNGRKEEVVEDPSSSEPQALERKSSKDDTEQSTQPASAITRPEIVKSDTVDIPKDPVVSTEPDVSSGEPRGGKRGKLARAPTEKSLTSSDTESNATICNRIEHGMKNGDLLKKQSIFAMTYDGIAAEKLPTD